MNLTKLGYWGLLCLSCINIYRISRYYLFSSPESWSLGTRNVLINLSTLYIPRISMYIHWWTGLTLTILSCLQILPIFRSPQYLQYHRIMGNIYCLCGVITSIAGNVFIYTNGTVGGFNMSCAFSVYGWLMFFTSIQTYRYAKRKDTKQHQKYAIRLWSLTISGLNYRLIYSILLGFGYEPRTPNDFSSLD